MCLRNHLPISEADKKRRDDNVAAVSYWHDELRSNFDLYSQVEHAVWYDVGLEPAYLHSHLDSLTVAVLSLTSDTENTVVVDDGSNSSRDSRSTLQPAARPKSLASLVERYSALVATLAAASQTAAMNFDWELSRVCSGYSQAFEESLWFMVVYLQESWGEMSLASANSNNAAVAV